MENSGDPNGGVPGGGVTSDNDTGWQEAFKKRQWTSTGETSKGKGGKGANTKAQMEDVRIISQGPKIKSSKHKIYEAHDLFDRPMVVSNAQGIPLANNAIADDAQLRQVKMATQRGLEELHAILISEYGPLSIH